MRNWFLSSSVIAALVVNFSARAAELSATDLKAAQKIYVTKCAKCHKMYEPTAYTDEEWSTWMLKMKKKAKLKDEPFRLINGYTEMLRKGTVSATNKTDKAKP